MRDFSVTTPQQAPMPRAAWQASAFAAVTAFTTAQSKAALPAQIRTASTSRDSSELPTLENRLLRSQGSGPSMRTGAGRGVIGTKFWLMLSAP